MYSNIDSYMHKLIIKQYGILYSKQNSKYDRVQLFALITYYRQRLNIPIAGIHLPHMNNAQIVKKRLKDLKLLSENLKQSSEQKLGLDLNVIKVIMNITKDVQANELTKASSHPFQKLKLFQPQYQNNQRRRIQQIKQFSNRATRESQQKNNPYARKFKRIQSMSYEDYEQQKTINQLYKTKQENQKLQQKIKLLQQKIKADQKQSEKEFKHLPYFELTQNLSIFLTKLKVNQKQYDKIEYQSAKLILTLDHIKVMVQPIKQQSEHQQKQKDTEFVQINIGDIVNVKYLHNYTVLYAIEGQSQEQLEYLFIKYENFQNMHRWDTGIYINYQIIKSLGSSQLFAINKVFEKLTVSDIQKSNKQAIQKQNQQKVQQQQQEIIRKSFKIGQQQNLTEQQKKLLLNFMNLQTQYLNVQNNVKQLVQRKSIVPPQKLTNQTKQTSQKVQNDNKQNKLQEFKTQKQAINIIPNHQEIEKVIEVNNSKLDSFEQLKNMKLEQMERQKNKIREKQEKQYQQLEEAKIILKRGMYVTKYAQGAFNPHQKKVFLSADQAKLCWQDKDKKQFKYVLISDIIQVNYGQIGPGIIKHIGKKNINNIHCFAVIKLKTQGRNQLEFGMRSANLMQNFSDKLTLFLESLNKKRIKTQQLKIF